MSTGPTPTAGTTSTNSSWRRCRGCTGSTTTGSTATATTSRQQSSKQRSMLPNRPPQSGLETNKPSLHQSQGGSNTGRRDGLSTGERAELKKLRSGNLVLRVEKDLLIQAAAFFAARTPRPGRGCSSSSIQRRATSASSSCATASSAQPAPSATTDVTWCEPRIATPTRRRTSWLQRHPGPLIAPSASRKDFARFDPSLTRLGWLRLKNLPILPAADEYRVPRNLVADDPRSNTAC